MNGITIMLSAIAVLGGGYLLYGRWLAKLWGVDPKAKTPAYEMEDGVDYPLGCLLPILFPKLKPSTSSSLAAYAPPLPKQPSTSSRWAGVKRMMSFITPSALPSACGYGTCSRNA